MKSKTNIYVKFLIRLAKKTARKENAEIWNDVADILSQPTRKMPEVNLEKLNKTLNDGETAIVPGKVLSGGILDQSVSIAALSFSHSAKEKIENVGGKTLKIEELIKENPKGSNVRIII